MQGTSMCIFGGIRRGKSIWYLGEEQESLGWPLRILRIVANWLNLSKLYDIV